MVGQAHAQLEYQEGGGSDNRVRCITDRLGSSMSGAEDRRSLDTSRIPDAHQLPGASGSHVCSADVCKNTTDWAMPCDPGCKQIYLYWAPQLAGFGFQSIRSRIVCDSKSAAWFRIPGRFCAVMCMFLSRYHIHRFLASATSSGETVPPRLFIILQIHFG